jgi:replicative DNA helicase
MAEIYPTKQSRQTGPDSPRDEGRIPPQAVDVEMSVLGAMLIEKEAIARAIDLLTEDAFYKEAHRRIFQGMVALFERSEPVDLVTLTEELRRRGVLEKIGGSFYLTELTNRITSAANIEYHARIVLEKSLMRRLIESSNEISGRAYEDSEDAFDLLDEAEQKIFTISERHLKRSFISMNQALHQTMEMLENIHGKHSGITGVPSGFTELDNITGGFQKSDLVVVAGRPAMEKLHWCFLRPVMPRSNMMHRSLSSVSKCPRSSLSCVSFVPKHVSISIKFAPVGYPRISGNT